MFQQPFAKPQSSFKKERKIENPYTRKSKRRIEIMGKKLGHLTKVHLFCG